MSLNISAFFAAHDHEYLKFEHIQSPRSPRSALHAFLLLDELATKAGVAPRGRRNRIIAAAAHDEIFFAVSPADIAAVATEQDLLDLIRCGVRYSQMYDCFSSFV